MTSINYPPVKYSLVAARNMTNKRKKKIINQRDDWNYNQKKNLIRPQKPKRPKKSKKPKRPKRVCLRQLFLAFFFLATFWVGKENWSRQNSSSIFLKRNYFFVVFVFRPDNFWSIDISPNEKFQTLPTKRQMRKICWKQLRKKTISIWRSQCYVSGG